MMAYTKKTWVTGEYFNADDMNHVESGIYDNAVTNVSIQNRNASFRNATGTELFSFEIPDTPIPSIVGGPITWNQVAPLVESAWTKLRASMSISGTAISVATTSSSSLKWVQFPLVKNHKYLVTTTLTASASSAFFIGIYSGTGSGYSTRYYVDAGESGDVSFIADNTYDTGNLRLCHPTVAANGTTASATDLMVFDLTAMFGDTVAGYFQALETAMSGAGIALFKALFVPQYQAYNAGANMTIGMY